MRLDVSGVRGVWTVIKSLFAQMSSRSALSMPICEEDDDNKRTHTHTNRARRRGKKEKWKRKVKETGTETKRSHNEMIGRHRTKGCERMYL